MTRLEKRKEKGKLLKGHLESFQDHLAPAIQDLTLRASLDIQNGLDNWQDRRACLAHIKLLREHLEAIELSLK